METTLTDCLIRVREDLKQLEKVRDYLETNAETQEHCSVTWRTIEAFNSILSACSSQNTPETYALDTLLDSFYHLAKNNHDKTVWDDFGFELGVICVKFLTAIERTDVFDTLLCKLLSVMNIICECNSKIWKATARQILNILINKKFPLLFLEEILKLYIGILRHIDDLTLYDFSLQNLHLLKSLSFLVQKVGDFEIQSDITELIFLHLSKNTKLMSDFFGPVEKKLFQSLQFEDFEDDCRLYLNALNKSRREYERKVYSISCLELFLGGCHLDLPIGREFFWIDANKESERLTFKCGEPESEGNRVICIQFSEILNVHLNNDEKRCLRIYTKSLKALQENIRNNEISFEKVNVDGLCDFVYFLETSIKERKRKKKHGGKISRTVDSLYINRSQSKLEVQDNAVTSSERPEKENNFTNVIEFLRNSSQDSKEIAVEPTAANKEMTPRTFIESLSKNLGLNSPEIRHTFEDSVDTVEFLQQPTPGKNHKLFRSPNEIFEISEPGEFSKFNLDFDEKKNFHSPLNFKQDIRTYSKKPKAVEKNNNSAHDKKILTEKKFNISQSQDYFCGIATATRKKKPSLPKLKKSQKKKKIPKENQGELNKRSFKNSNKINENLSILERESSKENIEERESPGSVIENTSVLPEKTEKPSRKELQNQKKSNRNNEIKEKEVENQTYKKVLRERKKESTNAAATKFSSQSKFKKADSTDPNISIKTKENHYSEKSKELQFKKREVRKERTEELHKSKKETSAQTKQNALKPSLLDPNGYAYQRWCKPTTSERSNFWLKKLDEAQKSKPNYDVFEFSEESDSLFGKGKKRKRVIHSKRKCRTIKETRQTSLKEVKEILKKSPSKVKSNLVSEATNKKNLSLHLAKKSVPSEKSIPEINKLEPVKTDTKAANTETSLLCFQSVNQNDKNISVERNQNSQQHAVSPLARNISLPISSVKPLERNENLLELAKSSLARGKSPLAFPPSPLSRRRSPTAFTTSPSFRGRSSSFNDLLHEDRNASPLSCSRLPRVRSSSVFVSSPLPSHDSPSFQAISPLPRERSTSPSFASPIFVGTNTAPFEMSPSQPIISPLPSNVSSFQSINSEISSPNRIIKENLVCNNELKENSLGPSQFEKNTEIENLNNEQSESEYESAGSSGEEEPVQTKKRNRSEEDSLRGNKKKPRHLPKKLLSSLRFRLQKAEEKDRRYLDEIIQTINKATNHLLSYLQRKDGEKTQKYLKTAESVSIAFDSGVEQLGIQTKRMQRAIVYFRAGCSISDVCETSEPHFIDLKSAIKSFKESRDSLKTVERINDRLNELINSEVEKSVQNEWALKKERLLKCATIFGADFGEFML